MLKNFWPLLSCTYTIQCVVVFISNIAITKINRAHSFIAAPSVLLLHLHRRHFLCCLLTTDLRSTSCEVFYIVTVIVWQSVIHFSIFHSYRHSELASLNWKENLLWIQSHVDWIWRLQRTQHLLLSHPATPSYFRFPTLQEMLVLWAKPKEDVR